MLQFLFDTDHLTLYQHKHPLLMQRIALQHLRAARMRVGTLDLKIAAIALTKGLTVLTRNRSDFGRVSGLAVEDWSV
jgi:predicted nucleic acid-binding protein